MEVSEEETRGKTEWKYPKKGTEGRQRREVSEEGNRRKTENGSIRRRAQREDRGGN